MGSVVESLLTSALYDMIKEGSVRLVDLASEGNSGLNDVKFRAGYVKVIDIESDRKHKYGG